MELGGWVVRRFIVERILDARRCVFHNAGATEIEELFEKLHTMLAGRKGYSVPELASVAHRVLGICAEMRNADGSQPKNSALVRRAEESAFSSAFHLSAAFKKAYGMSPDAWRKQLTSGPGR